MGSLLENLQIVMIGLTILFFAVHRLGLKFEVRGVPGVGALTSQHVKQGMLVFLSVAVMIAGLYVILSGTYSGDMEQWAAGCIGTILGFWFRGKK